MPVKGEKMELTKEEVLFISNCLIAYQAELRNTSTFGCVSDAITEQVAKISELNTKLLNSIERKD